MADPEEGRFYERPWFKGTGAVVALALSLATAIGLVIGLVTGLFSSSPPHVNTEIVFDASAAMQDRFVPNEPATKLAVGQEAVAEYARPIANQGLALRSFGGCGQNGQLAVGFGTNHADDVTSAAERQQPRGGSDLGDAVRAAIDDLTALPEDSVKRVVVFTGGAGQCGGTCTSARDITEFLQGTGVTADFRLVGLGVSSEAKSQLECLARGLGKGAEAQFAYSRSQLHHILNQLPGPSETTTTGTSDTAGVPGGS